MLFLLYGPRSPSAPYEDLGDLAPIVHLTDVAEAARVQLALRVGEEEYARVAREYPNALQKQREAIASEFWRAASVLQRIEASRKWSDVERAIMRARQCEFLDRLLEAYTYDGTVPARISAIAKPDREITLEAAVRWRLQLPNDSENRPLLDVSKAHQAARAAFVATARRSAERLRIEASEAYQDALEAAKVQS
ncbi:MAG TPA: hypothetical protein VNO21_03570 [Polyangiaceae bacterium]|nr:hypothetical protein [Polyangiaceae bacterium]